MDINMDFGVKRESIPHSAVSVAAYIVHYCNRKGYLINNLKLQKILYFVQAQFLVNRGRPCFKEKIEAWQFGPVVPEVYHKYKFYGGTAIKSSNQYKMWNISNDDKKEIEVIVDECAKYSTSQLVNITHKQTPWLKAYSENKHNHISNESIFEYFSI